MNRMFAAAADEDRLTGPDLEHRNEKNAQIVVNPLEVGLMQAAPWAAPRSFVQGFDLGLDAANKEKEALDHDRCAEFGWQTRCLESGMVFTIFINFTFHTTVSLARQAGANAVSIKTGFGRCP
jgi:hypothetical protein